MRPISQQVKDSRLSLSRRIRKMLAEHPCPCHVVCDTLVHLALRYTLGSLLLLAGIPVLCAEVITIAVAVWCGYTLLQHLKAGGE